MANRQEWEHATEQSRHLAIAADAELRRRHRDQKIEPLRSAEPVPGDDAGRGQLHAVPDHKIGETAEWIRDLTLQHQAFRAKMDERQRLMAPREDPAWGDLGGIFPARQAPGRDAILQAPKPQIAPSATIFQLAAEHDTEPEAAD